MNIQLKLPSTVQSVLLTTLALMLALFTLSADELLPESLHEGSFVDYGHHVLIRGVVRGNVYAIGSQLDIDGVVTGSVYAIGGAVTVKGQVQGALNVAGALVQVSGAIGGKTRVLAAQVNTTAESQLLGLARVAAGTADINGRIHGGLDVHAGRVDLRGQFSGPVHSVSGEFEIEPAASFDGPIIYWSRLPGQIAAGARTPREVEAHILGPSSPDQNWLEPWLGDFAQQLIGWMLHAIDIFYMLIAGAFLIWLFPHDLHKAIVCLKRHPFPSLGTGVITVIVLPLLGLLFLLTLLGIPVALTILAINVFGLYTARVIVVSLLGSLILPRQWDRHRFRVFFAGIIPFLLISAIPTVGSLFSLLAMIAGLGAAVLSHKQSYKA